MKKLLTNKLIRYAIVGVITLGVYMVVGMLLNQSRMAVMWMAPFSFSAAIIVNYILQKIWVFQDTRPVTDSLPKFFTMTLVGYAINSFLLYLLIPDFPLPVAQLIAASTIVISNALFSFLWVFATHSKIDF